MNRTMEKFGYPRTLLADLEHWAILLRPAQVTLGSLVLAAKSDVTAFSALPDGAYAQLGEAVTKIETALADFCAYDRINYLMLMMVDPNVHFHVIPRYSEPRAHAHLHFPDVGWPGPPQLGSAVQLSDEQIAAVVAELKPRLSGA